MLVNFIYIAKYHKSQFAKGGFIICTVNDTLYPWTLNSDREKQIPKTSFMKKKN